MPVKINILTTPNSESIFLLEGTPYIIRTTINVRSGEDPSKGRWYMDISDMNKNIILGGVKIMPNQNLTYRYGRSTRKIFDGDIWCVDTLGTERVNDVTNGTLGAGERYELLYYTKAEMIGNEIYPLN